MLAASDKITQNLNIALTCLRSGEVVAFPTETVYGLGADALDELAIKKVFSVKGRPADHPLIVHLASAVELSSWAIDIPDSAWILAEHFWPGPLTMILRKKTKVSNLITGGQDTIALRIPNHPLALELIKQFGSGLVGPSANKYGHVSPTTAMHVAADFGNQLGAILDGGACNIGIESTIINLATNAPTIMRQGMISAAQIAAVLNTDVATNANINAITRTPGSDESHYAPYTPLHLIKSNEFIPTVIKHITKSKSFSVISFQAKPNDLPANIYWQKVSTNPEIYARSLYANLRAHDLMHNAAILIEDVPPDDLAWAAIADRLSRASIKE
jgi:L-threonylcarbamoyladenylate synthase